MLHRIRCGALIALLLTILFVPSSALAHEHRNLGPYELVVGFAVEPALAGQPNGATIRVRTIADKQPVTGLADALKVQLVQGSKTKDLTLTEAFGDPGLYVAHFIPGVPGDYTFVFTGKINDQTLNERFESGPNRFSSVEDPAPQVFPPSTTAASGGLGNVLPWLAVGLSVLALVLSGLNVARRPAQSRRVVN